MSSPDKTIFMSVEIRRSPVSGVAVIFSTADGVERAQMVFTQLSGQPFPPPRNQSMMLDAFIEALRDGMPETETGSNQH
jgi:hypothetical protein